MTTPQIDLPTPTDVSAYLAGAVEVASPEGPVPSIDRLTEGLTGLGLRHGEVVLISMPNSRAMLACFFAVLLPVGCPHPSPRERRGNALKTLPPGWAAGSC